MTINNLKLEQVKDFPDYFITKCGRVFSNRTKNFKELKPSICKGYKRLTLYNESRSLQIQLHQLLAMHFLNHEPCGHARVVDHIDGDRINNKISNLQIITNRENTSKNRPYRGLPLGVRISRSGNKYISEIKINNKTTHLGTFSTMQEASHAYQKRLAEIESEAK